MQTILKNGCHVVPIGDGDSSAANLQWRISFSLAERTLAHTYNHTQLLIYSILKLVLKRVINLLEPDCMCSYVVKTTLLYCIENTEATMWETNQLNLCYNKCLILLCNFVDIMFCPNYFMRDYNLFRTKINSENRPRVLSLLRSLLQLGISGALYHTEECRILVDPITDSSMEFKFDLEILRGYLFQKLIVEIRTMISFSPNTSYLHEEMIQQVVEAASQSMMTEEARDVTLLLSRIISSYTASKIERLRPSQPGGNKCSYNIRKLITTFYRRGADFDVSLGRLRYATHLLMMSDVDKCLKIIQIMLSAITHYVQFECCHSSYPLQHMYEQAICGRRVSLAKKSQEVLACAVMFLPCDYHNVPVAVRVLMCGGMVVGCTESVTFDPLVYAYYLQGICFIRKGNSAAIKNSVSMLKERLYSNKFVDLAVPMYRANVYSLLGWLELERNDIQTAMRYFIKSYIFRQQIKRSIIMLTMARIDFAHLNLGIACNKLINTTR